MTSQHSAKNWQVVSTFCPRLFLVPVVNDHIDQSCILHWSLLPLIFMTPVSDFWAYPSGTAKTKCKSHHISMLLFFLTLPGCGGYTLVQFIVHTFCKVPSVQYCHLCWVVFYIYCWPNLVTSICNMSKVFGAWPHTLHSMFKLIFALTFPVNYL